MERRYWPTVQTCTAESQLAMRGVACGCMPLPPMLVVRPTDLEPLAWLWWYCRCLPVLHRCTRGAGCLAHKPAVGMQQVAVELERKITGAAGCRRRQQRVG